MKRLTYLIVTIITLVIGSIALQMMKAIESSGDLSGAYTVFSLILFVMYILYIVATFYRFKGTNINPWWSLTGLIPLVTVGTWLVALFAKPKVVLVEDSVMNLG